MTHRQPGPPKLAGWLLRHACPATDKEALAGDLVEAFREGRSRGWYWKQVLMAIGVGVLNAFRRRWPEVYYAIAGIVLIALGWFVPLPPGYAGLVALPVLAVALRLNGEFRWVSLIGTVLFYIMLSPIILWALGQVLTSPLDTDETNRSVLILARIAFFILVVPSTMLVSAWLGCRPEEPTPPAPSRPAAGPGQ